jgi:hypothetical protein
VIPKLDPEKRKSEFKKATFDETSKIVHTWLFKEHVAHREMDRNILGLDSKSSKGFKSMSILHHLGLKKNFKGIFLNSDLNQAISQLKKDNQDFEIIIELLENMAEDGPLLLIESLYETGKLKDKNFDEHLKHQLSELENTDRHRNQAQSRKEQGILRGILFKDDSEKKCAICHRILPTNLMVAAHIKPRNKCSTSERKNPNVVMPICKVGCDDFFEKGYIIVDSTGILRKNERMNYSPELGSILRDIIGKRCTHFNEDTANFFSYKRDDLILP